MDSNIYVETRKTIFLADRNESFLIYLRILLERMGFRIVPLKKGAILQDLVQVMKPDLVMLGSFLDDMDGISVLRSLRQNKDFSGVPVVMFCDSEYEECSQTISELGGVKYLSRPINIFQLYKVVYDIIVFSSGQKRLHLRTSFHEKVRLTHGKRETELWSTSLSEGGIFVRTREPIPGGEDVTVSVPLGFDTPALLKGKVLYSKDVDSGGVLNVPGSAIQFVSVAPEQAAQLRICILGLLVGDLLEEQRGEPIFSVVSRTNDMYEDIILDHIRIGNERRQAEEKVRQSEQFIRSILDTVDEGFIVIDRNFRILTANKAYCNQVGESCDSVIGRPCYEISHKTHRPCYEEGEECAVRHVFQTGEPHTALHKHPDAEGSILYVETKAFPVKDSTGAVTSVIETVNNITEKHLLEEEQMKTQKLEAIATLAGGIAHDFNNLLQGVFGYISMAKIMHDQKQDSLDMLEEAEKALRMSVGLTSQLLTFSKGGKPLTKRIALRPVIEKSVKFALSGSRLDYRIQVAEDLWMVEADEGQLGQVIQNLVLNAEQAMPMGGTITITAKNVSPGEKELPPVLQHGNYVVISVIDRGIGIPEEHLPKIFDPYFTTKDKGSGLGLATSYSIIKNHDGLINVKSKIGEGTTFSVYLPAVEVVETSAVTVSGDVKARRKGRILLMDDEGIVRDIAGVMIRSLGHEVELAEDGEKAIDKYRESMKAGRKFDAVILDLTVRGGMGGEEAIKVLLQMDPHIKALVSSGYAESSVIAEYKTIGFKACLTKPYDIVLLNRTLNNLLE
jgi:PAS domain S-box-containing protein